MPFIAFRSSSKTTKNKNSCQIDRRVEIEYARPYESNSQETRLLFSLGRWGTVVQHYYNPATVVACPLAGGEEHFLNKGELRLALPYVYYFYMKSLNIQLSI